MFFGFATELFTTAPSSFLRLVTTLIFYFSQMFFKNFFTTSFIFLSCALPFFVEGQVTWVLKKDKDAIRIYTRDTENSSFKSVKVTCTIPGTLSQLTALLLDVSAHERWVYNTKNSYLVKQINKNQQIYYSEIALPWPLANREVVVFMKIAQDPLSKVLQVNIDNVDNQIPVKNGTVRVRASSVTWKVTPLKGNQLSIEYFGNVDPGGSVPGWIANAFSTKGPFETFKKLRQLVTSPAYAKASFDFIRE